MPAVTAQEPGSTEARPRPRGRRPASLTMGRHPTTDPDWRYHHLTISGPSEPVAAFAGAARGSGIIPWRLDSFRIEEDVFNLAVSQPASRRNLTVEGCRILARQFCERVEAHQARATALVGRSLACPFDLNVLLPVPAPVLQLGPTDPAALAWLTRHWGVTDRLRRVSEGPNLTVGRRLPSGHAVIGYGFFTAGSSPHAAIGQLATDWPALRFLLMPRPLD
jgi:hypothetical protein